MTSEKRNVLLLAGAQALFQTASVLLVTIVGLVGYLSGDKSLSTLPMALSMVVAVAMMIPAALFMQRFGRRTGFLLGTLLGSVAGLLGAYAIWQHSYWLFAGATMLMGGYQGFAQYYRFAAADVASIDFKSRAIAWVIAGGIIAAIAGPNIARLTQDMGSYPFMASFIALFMLSVVGLLVVSRLQLPPITTGNPQQGESRPLWRIMCQPKFITALMGSTVGYAVMLMIMTATPLAMQISGHSISDAATVIQWHVLGMFLPSFFTGNLIRRFGVLTIMWAGVLLLFAHVLIALRGDAFINYLLGLTLVGVGWNFLFIGGTTLLTRVYQPAEQAKTQAAHNFLMFAATGLASFSAGGLLHTWGWQSVNYTASLLLLPVMLALLMLALWYRRERTVHL